MATLVTVLKTGGRYDARWVERLARGAERFAPAFTRFVCLTDDAGLDLAGVETVPLRHDWPAWWAKMEAFRPGLFTGTTVLCDLDTVFCGDADALAQPGLLAMEDYFHKGRLSSAILRWQGDELGHIYERFAADPARWMLAGACGPVPNAVHGDQVVIDHFLREKGMRPRFVQEAHPGLLDFYDAQKPIRGSVMVFIGDSKPDKAVGPVRALWEGLEAAGA
ncbi:hypothetical protein [Aureimonas psammosilenae]|uniref:hypothetical protein n=1 Tax=Aureimonas psammosilenae TaxID=2495496 RepID=UPI00126105C8|nr:hypothetical protein [Aureimonas psammosilenae]